MSAPASWVGKAASVAAGAAAVAVDSVAQPTTEGKVDTAVQEGAAVAEGLAGPYAPVIAAGVQLEPAIYHFVSFLIHAFRKPAPAPAPKPQPRAEQAAA